MLMFITRTDGALNLSSFFCDDENTFLWLMNIIAYFVILSGFCLLSVGERTIGVLTKIDLMDKGTDAVDVSHFCYYSGIKLPIKEDLLPSLNKWNLLNNDCQLDGYGLLFFAKT